LCGLNLFRKVFGLEGRGGNEPGLIYALDGVLVTGKDSRNGMPRVVD